jgi:hypothetical protein
MRVSCQLSDLLCVAYEEVCVCCNHNTFREILQQGRVPPSSRLETGYAGPCDIAIVSPVPYGYLALDLSSPCS